MAFFTKRNKQNVHQNNYQKGTRKRKNEKYRLKNQDDEITSSEDEQNTNNILNDHQSSEDEHETTQEKKLRLTNIYLEEIKRAEKNRLENEADEEVDNDIIRKRLKEDHLKQLGKFKSSVADSYSSVDSDNISILKCKQHRNSITSVCISEDNFLYSGSKDGTVAKWSLTHNRKISSLPRIPKNVASTSTEIKGHTKGITSIAISSDNKFLGISDETNEIQVWDPEKLKHIHTLKGHRKPITAITFRRGTHTLYSCGKDHSVKVWSLDEMMYVETLYGHQSVITGIDALSKEAVITSGGSDLTIRLWKIPEESQLIYSGHSGDVDCIKLIDEHHFLSGGDDGNLCVWSTLKKKPICVVKNAHGCNDTNAQPHWITSIATLINTDLIATGSCDGHIKIWRLKDHFKVIELLFEVPVIGFVNCLSFDADGKSLIAGIGQEHKFGRWSVIKEAKNCILKIPLIKKT